MEERRTDNLGLAAERGDHEVVKWLLRQGTFADTRHLPAFGLINNGGVELCKLDSVMIEVIDGDRIFHAYANDFKRTPLQAAAAGGYDTIVTTLLEAGANLNAQAAGAYGRTALQAAAEGGHQRLVTLLIAAGADVNALPAETGGMTALQAAAACGDIELVTSLINASAMVNAPPSKTAGRTTLQAAAGRGHGELVTLLVNAGADVNAPPAPTYGRTALQAAVEGGHEEAVHSLITAGAAVNAGPAEDEGRTALEAAVKGAYRGLVQFLISAGADVNAHLNEYSETALQIAVKSNHEELVKLLLSAGADVNAHLNETALQIAVKSNHEELVKLLLDAGADVNAHLNEYSETALQIAVKSNHEELVKLLLDAGADVNAHPNETALQIAVKSNREGLVKLLLDAGADVNAHPNEYSETALQIAVKSNDEELVKLLLNAGADVNAHPNNYSGMALQIAVKSNHEELVKLLLNAGADVNARRSQYSNETVLHLAVKSSYEELVKLLLDAGADVNARGDQETALQIAVGRNCGDLVKLLLDAGADVNAPPPARSGKTVLQIAVGCGNLELVPLLLRAGALVSAENLGARALLAVVDSGNLKLVQLLVNAGADINPPGTSLGVKAMLVAVVAGSLELVTLLIGAGVDVNDFGNKQSILITAAQHGHQQLIPVLLGAGAHVDAAVAIYVRKALQAATASPPEDLPELPASMSVNQDEAHTHGQSPLHQACQTGDIDKVNALLQSSTSDMNAQDHKGSTPLHTALRERHNSIAEILTNGGANVDHEDHSGETPLQIAFDTRSSAIIDLILGKSRIAPCVKIGNVFSSPEGHADNHMDAITLHAGPGGQKSLQWTDRAGTEVCDIWDAKWISYSVCVFRPISGAHTSSLHPRDYLVSYRYPPQYAPTTDIEWAWLRIEKQSNRGSWLKGIPTSKDVLVSGGRSVFLVGYFYINVPTEILSSASGLIDGPAKPFEFRSHNIESSWIMRDHIEAGSDSIMRSMHYRGSFNMKQLSLPDNAVSFFLPFLDDIHEKWLQHVEKVSWHLARISDRQLREGGQDASVILCLLQDSRQCKRLQAALAINISKVRNALRTFTNYEVIYSELSSAEGQKSLQPVGEYPAIIALSSKIEAFETECGGAIQSLELEIKEMINLEFNLVSIHEARRSIEMSATSLSMAMSMKRLNWITFIFLPLVFTTGLFGMNVDILSKNPSWHWGLVFACGVLALVLLGWIVFKYIPIAKWIEDHIGAWLKVKTSTSYPTSPNGADEDEGFEATAKPREHSFATMMVASQRRSLPRKPLSATTVPSWLRQRPVRHNFDEESTPPATAVATVVRN